MIALLARLHCSMYACGNCTQIMFSEGLVVTSTEPCGRPEALQHPSCCTTVELTHIHVSELLHTL